MRYPLLLPLSKVLAQSSTPPDHISSSLSPLFISNQGWIGEEGEEGTMEAGVSTEIPSRNLLPGATASVGLADELALGLLQA